MVPVALAEWNRTEVDYPRQSTIAELFQAQVARTPEAIAIVDRDSELSYSELDERSNRLARHLQGMGVKPETLVGVALERSETLVVSLLGILKAGGAYVPLDPAHPRERMARIIDDSRMPVLLTSQESNERLPLVFGDIEVVNGYDPILSLYRPDAVPSHAKSHNLAYVIYTSGSTGTPKGVMVEHRNVANLFTGMDRAIGCDPGVWLAVSSVSSDSSVLELLWTLTRGFKVVLHSGEGTEAIADQIQRHAVTHFQMTPTLARRLTQDAHALAALGSLKQMLLGKEALPASLVRELRTVCKGQIYNMYGATETTIWSTTYPIQELAISVPIGRPIANTQIHLLDLDLKPVPAGDVGELFIGGDGVARGYWGRPDLTAERFLTIPAPAASRLYRTGDLARYRPDGNLQFLGRVD